MTQDLTFDHEKVVASIAKLDSMDHLGCVDRLIDQGIAILLSP